MYIVLDKEKTGFNIGKKRKEKKENRSVPRNLLVVNFKTLIVFKEILVSSQ